jgi:magnesium transporter
VPRTRCYHDGRLSDQDFPVADISEHLEEPGAVVWVDLCDPTRDDLQLVARELNLHELAVEDALHRHQRPKLDRYADHAFLAAYAVRFDAATSRLATSEVAAFVTGSALITVRHDEHFDIDAVVRRWDTSTDLAGHGVPFLLHGLLDYVVDGHFEAVTALDEQLDDLEDQLFLDSTNQLDLQRRTFDLRKSLVLLRRVVLPMREVINTLIRRDLRIVDEAMGPYFQDVYDHVLRASEWTESLRDLVNSILETNLTVQGNRLNIITKQVTGWAAIIAIPTAITGFYGQNVPYPGFGTHSGFVASTATMIVGSVLLYVLFRRKDWL